MSQFVLLLELLDSWSLSSDGGKDEYRETVFIVEIFLRENKNASQYPDFDLNIYYYKT
jgi:hypothetical protein